MRLGILEGGAGRPFETRLIRPGNPTNFEKAMLERFHGEILAGVLFPGAVGSSFKVNYVQPEISEPPYWRDVYLHDAKGKETGWVRWGDEEPREFNAEGLLVLEKDPRGRPLKARTMKYEPEKPSVDKAGRRRGPFWRRTLQIPGEEIRYYDYAGEDDRTGRVVRTERVDQASHE